MSQPRRGAREPKAKLDLRLRCSWHACFFFWFCPCLLGGAAAAAANKNAVCCYHTKSRADGFGFGVTFTLPSNEGGMK